MEKAIVVRKSLAQGLAMSGIIVLAAGWVLQPIEAQSPQQSQVRQEASGGEDPATRKRPRPASERVAASAAPVMTVAKLAPLPGRPPNCLQPSHRGRRLRDRRYSQHLLGSGNLDQLRHAACVTLRAAAPAAARRRRSQGSSGHGSVASRRSKPRPWDRPSPSPRAQLPSDLPDADRHGLVSLHGRAEREGGWHHRGEFPGTCGCRRRVHAAHDQSHRLRQRRSAQPSL